MYKTRALLLENPCNERLWSHRLYVIKHAGKESFDKLAELEFIGVMRTFLPKDWRNEVAWKYLENYTTANTLESIRN